jgi:hypothetical protein
MAERVGLEIASAALVLALNARSAAGLGLAPSLREVFDLWAGRRSPAQERG